MQSAVYVSFIMFRNASCVKRRVFLDKRERLVTAENVYDSITNQPLRREDGLRWHADAPICRRKRGNWRIEFDRAYIVNCTKLYGYSMYSQDIYFIRAQLLISRVNHCELSWTPKFIITFIAFLSILYVRYTAAP